MKMTSILVLGLVAFSVSCAHQGTYSGQSASSESSMPVKSRRKLAQQLEVESKIDSVQESVRVLDSNSGLETILPIPSSFNYARNSAGRLELMPADWAQMEILGRSTPLGTLLSNLNVTIMTASGERSDVLLDSEQQKVQVHYYPKSPGQPKATQARSFIFIRMDSNAKTKFSGKDRKPAQVSSETFIAAVLDVGTDSNDSGIEIWINPKSEWIENHRLTDNYTESQRAFVELLAAKLRLCNESESAYSPCRAGVTMDQVKKALAAEGVVLDPEFQKWAEGQISGRR